MLAERYLRKPLRDLQTSRAALRHRNIRGTVLNV